MQLPSWIRSPYSLGQKLSLGFLIFASCSLILLALWVVQPTGGQPGSRPGPSIDPKALERHVRYLAEDCLPRNSAHPHNLDKSAAYIQEEFRKSGARVQEQRFMAHKQSYANVLARFGPEEGPMLVVGAHYDAYGSQPGADDNASGVAGLLELARILNQNPPGRPVELVAYTLEEPPHFRKDTMGSAIHASQLRQSGQDLRAVIVLEMLGCYKDEAHSQDFPISLLSLIYPTTGNYAVVVGRFSDRPLLRQVKRSMREGSELPIQAMCAPRFVKGVDFSDHRSYWAQDYSAVMITDTAFYRNKNYHKLGDKPENLDYRRMALAVKSVARAVLDLAS